MISPHIWWAYINDWPPIQYAMGKTGYAWASSFGKAAGTAVAGIAINAVPTLILISALARHSPQASASGWRRLLPPDRRWLVILALFPTIMTILLGVTGYVKISIGFLIPAFFMFPLMIMLAMEASIKHATTLGVARAVVMVMICALLAAPGIALASYYFQIKGTSDVSHIATRDAAGIWNDLFKVPVRIVAGSEKYSIAQPFYGASNPDEFTHFSLAQAPWITPARIAAEGILTICDKADIGCIGFAEQYATPETKRVAVTINRSFGGIKGPDVPLIYIMTPPVK